MRPVSKKRQRANRESKPVRDQLKSEFECCMLCMTSQELDVHEITRGASRGVSLGWRPCLMCFCRRCHDLVQNWTVAQQLCLKAIVDLEHYDRVFVNRVRGRADDSISERDVWQELKFVTRELRLSGRLS